MVYKSKKINKRRYLKTQSRKFIEKKIYGGQGDVSQEKVEYNNVHTPTISENIGDVANVAASGVSALIADGAQTLSENIGINPNISLSENIKESISNTGEVLKEIKETMNSPEGQELLHETGEITKDMVKTLKPAAEETVNIMNDLVKKEMPILTDMGEKFVLGLPGIGTAVAAGEELIDAAGASATAAASLAKLSETGSETLVDLNKQKSKIQSLIDSGIKLYNNLNKGVSNVISSAQKQVDDYSKNTKKRKMEYIDDSLKKYNKEKMMVGGRIKEAQLEFLSPSINRSQLLQQYGGKWKTKRRNNLKRKVTSRSYK